MEYYYIMRLIPLTKGLFVKVDNEDYVFYATKRWYSQQTRKGKFYAARSEWIPGSDKARIVYLHRQIMNAPTGMYVDHKNGDTLDCQRKNMRICTNAQNNWNKSKNRNNTSGEKGVFWDIRHKKWKVYVTANGKQYSGGTHNNKEDALLSRDALYQNLHGEFVHV